MLVGDNRNINLLDFGIEQHYADFKMQRDLARTSKMSAEKGYVACGATRWKHIHLLREYEDF